MRFVLALLSVVLVVAQDPANGWMAYAVGSIPSGVERITTLQMQWKVGADPPRGTGAFFSPWFGMDPSDNLNLIQPVNPWLGSSWVGYTEYFQWRPVHNSNSRQVPVSAGQTLKGTLQYDQGTDSYTLTQEVVETGEKSSQVVKCQNGKKYTLPYVVYEKLWPCRDYPPDGKVTFTDIYAECDGKNCTSEIKWTALVKDSNCNMQANVNTDGTISITWDTALPSRFDNTSYKELFNLNLAGPETWANKYAQELKQQFRDRF